MRNENFNECSAIHAHTQEFNMQYLVRFLFLLISLVCILGCHQPQSSYAQRVFCDAETVENGKFISQGEFFDHANYQTDEKAFSGNHSVLLQKGREYGMTYHINDVKEGERFIVRVKRHSKTSKGSLEFAGRKIGLCHAATSRAINKKSVGGWDELELNMLIPFGVDSVLIYVRNNKDEPVYFDDLEILRYNTTDPVYKGFQPIKFYLDSLDLAEMVQLREAAVQGEVIDDKTKKEFSCILSYKGEHFSGTIRFKGDWTDHLKSDKWSYRIELDGGKTIMGKRTFSIQHPGTRGFAKEWLLHKLLQREGVLTTMYTFLPVEMNDKALGLYAFEEHFEKQLLESQDRREGVILKFDEELFWEAMLLKNRDNIHHNFPSYEAAYIKPFGKKRLLKSKSLKKQLVLGNNLLEMYRTMNPDIDIYLDVERYAKYLAIVTLTNTHAHSAEWHNQRWYVNPVSAKLEPIVFDLSDDFVSGENENKIFSMLMKMHEHESVSTKEYLHAFVFKNQKFQQRYLAHLERMIGAGYLDSTLKELNSEINEIDLALSQEYPNQRVEKGVLFDNVQKVKQQLPGFKTWLKDKLLLVQPDTANRRQDLHPIISTKLPVKVYEQSNTSYVIENNGGHQVSVFGYKSNESKDTVILTEELKIGVSHWQRNRVELQLNEKASAIYYRIDEAKFTGEADIFKWPVPRSYSPRTALISNLAKNQSDILVIKNGGYRIKKGTHTINELLYIPSGSTLVIDAGTELILNEGGGLLSESPVQIIGSEKLPVVIRSESQYNQGITVLQANGESTLKHVQFQSMNNLSFDGWVLSGGINFYESDVVMDNCTISDGRSEDALNIIRSNFALSSCKIKNSKSDGFDSDFSKGSVVNCTFTDIGNDAVDFSGSKVELKDCELLNIGDKAVSVGEQSILIIKHSTITNATIGVAAKDRSHASLSHLEIADCKYGYVAYTKKSEYGGATIKTEDITLKNVEKEWDIELKSKLIKDGVTIPGTEYSKVTKY
ncbi:MAG TPA: hypothetical protein DCR04_10000 [Flavobacteriales bacterium]|nr:hypothetical protein [Flavobacteriales bacterium]